MVLNQDGIFSRAEQATEKYGKAKARETLELAFGNLQAEKYEAKLTTERLDARITEEIGKMSGEEIGDDKTEVIVDGYRFTVDRTVPKIIEELGPADGVIISASITQNNDWSNPKATVTGIIKTYSGGKITSSTAEVIKGNADVSSFPTTGGSFTIANIGEDTDIKITATDSNKKTNTRTIKVVLVRDNTPPVISNETATVIGMIITIKADVEDVESGIASFTYNVTGPGTVTPESGTSLTTGETKELTTSEPGNYTVTFTATNGAGKQTTTKGITVTTTDAILMEDLKNITAENYASYIGKKVDYKPEAGGTWRVFYCDSADSTHLNGYFGDGDGTVYLKRDCDFTISLGSYIEYDTKNGGELMKQLNPQWAGSTLGKAIDQPNEHSISYLYDETKWLKYKTVDAKYAIGSAPVEMWVRAQTAFREAQDPKAGSISLGLGEFGYTLSLSGGYNEGNTPGLTGGKSCCVSKLWADNGESNVFVHEQNQLLASPHAGSNKNVCIVHVAGANGGSVENYSGFICPVVAIQK